MKASLLWYLTGPLLGYAFIGSALLGHRPLPNQAAGAMLAELLDRLYIPWAE